jgi:hypothetical protein
MTNFLQPPGTPSSVEELPSVAREYAAAIRQCPNFELRESLLSEDAGVLVVDAFAGVPPRSPFGVQSVERLAIEVKADQAPKVHALRSDFPHLPHQNLVAVGEPRQLCLSDTPWEEECATETPPRRLRRITEWLERAASGELYAPDQPLEPYVFSLDRLVVPSDLFQAGQGMPYAVIKRSTLLAIQPSSPIADIRYVVMPLLAQPTDEQVVHSLPAHFGQLAKLLEPLGIDLVGLVKEATKGFVLNEASHMLGLRWLFLIRLPRVTPERSTESEDVAFLLEGCTVEELGKALGVVTAGAGMVALDLGDITGGKRDYDLGLGTVLPLNPVPQLTTRLAANMSGHEPPARDRQMAIIGVGALGSSVVLNLCRQGVAPSVLVDHDVVLPHNLARYQLSPDAVGMNKAECVARIASTICADAAPPKSFADDVLKLTEESEASQAMRETHLAVDCTTSRAAMRRLARMTRLRRRASCYIAASGSDLVVLNEGTQGGPRIDDLDVQFSYACATKSGLHGVLTAQSTARVRYAGGCSDLSAVLDASTVMALSAIASARIRTIDNESDSSIRVWRYERLGPSVEAVEIASLPVSVREFAGGWQLRMSDSAVEQMRGFRESKLPDETGGVLLGAFDASCGVVYVAGVLPSPPDSDEWPTSYIRGSQGLRAQVEGVSRLSGNELGYVGEWHSHPQGSIALLSGDDAKALAELAITMGHEGLPGVVVVVSDEQWEAGLTFLL